LNVTCQHLAPLEERLIRAEWYVSGDNLSNVFIEPARHRLDPWSQGLFILVSHMSFNRLKNSPSTRST
jgi:hypothetical protein